MYAIGAEIEADFQLYFGAFAGKHSFDLKPRPELENTFAFTLEGNFEVKERILYPCDSLYIPTSETLDIECLSATGILIVLYF